MNARSLATTLILRNDVLAAGDRFTAALDESRKNFSNGKDATDHLIGAAKSYNELQQILGSTDPTGDQQARIDRLTDALGHAKDTDTPQSIAKNAKVDLTPLNKNRSAEEYGKYGKLASTYARALIFDEARFNNSQVLKNTPLGSLQRPGQSVLDPAGPNGRLGILLGTRINSAASNFTKAGSMFMSGIQKLKDGKDPTDDFVGGGAAAGQGMTEISAGAGTDFGNHLVKKRQLARAQSPGKPQGAGTRSEGTSNTNGASTQNAGSSSRPDDARSIASIDKQVDTDLDKSNTGIDQQVADRQKELQEQAIKRIEGKHPDVKQLELQDAVSDISGEYIEMQKLGNDLKKSAKEEALSAHSNLQEIDAESQVQMRKINDLGYDSAEAARASGDRAALDAAKRLDELGTLRHEAYDQFNRAMAERENLINNATPAYKELGEALKSPTQEARQSALAEWSDKYGKAFEKYQSSFLSQTDKYPEWWKISKPLRAQLMPALLGTAFGAAGFGASLDSYLKKQAAGTLTTQDKVALSGQVFNLVSGAVGFIPVGGPFASFVFATVGAVLGGFADQYEDWRKSEAKNTLQNGIREEYNKRHPDQQIAEPFDGG
jgi:hypothetical protein